MMSINKTINIMYFSDILCIWAYIAQKRIDKLKKEYAGDVQISEHFLPIFGAVNKKINDNWQNQGGLKGYNQHVLEVASQFDYVVVSDDIWLKNTPTTSISCHIFVKAAELHLKTIMADNKAVEDKLSQLIWQLRADFFEKSIDVSSLKEQMRIAAQLKLSDKDIYTQIESGNAMAALDIDRQLKEQYGLKGSPSLVLDNGRQILFGNVSYEVISSNVKALLDNNT